MSAARWIEETYANRKEAGLRPIENNLGEIYATQSIVVAASTHKYDLVIDVRAERPAVHRGPLEEVATKTSASFI